MLEGTGDGDFPLFPGDRYNPGKTPRKEQTKCHEET